MVLTFTGVVFPANIKILLLFNNLVGGIIWDASRKHTLLALFSEEGPLTNAYASSTATRIKTGF